MLSEQLSEDHPPNVEASGDNATPYTSTTVTELDTTKPAGNSDENSDGSGGITIGKHSRYFIDFSSVKPSNNFFERFFLPIIQLKIIASAYTATRQKTLLLVER